MRKLLIVAGLLLAFVLGAAPSAAVADTSSGDVSTLPQPKPSWLTSDLEAKILAAGSKGVEVKAADLMMILNGVDPGSVRRQRRYERQPV